MEYNSQRTPLMMQEYGRNVQQMIMHAVSLPEKEERNKMAKAIIKVMVQVNPKTKELENYEHKLWDHLFIISGYKLDVESPFPMPSPTAFETKPERVKYPALDIRYKHYGKTVQDLIVKAIATEEGEAKDAFVLSIANLMKRDYLIWNKDSVNDDVILEHLKDLSMGKLLVKDPTKIIASNDVQRNTPTAPANNNQRRKRPSGRNNNNNNRKKRN